MLKWAVEHGYPWDTSGTCDEALAGGDEETLTWMRGAGLFHGYDGFGYDKDDEDGFGYNEDNANGFGYDEDNEAGFGFDEDNEAGFGYDDDDSDDSIEYNP